MIIRKDYDSEMVQDLKVFEQINRYVACKHIELAKNLADKGQNEKAQDIIKETLEYIDKSPAKDTELSKFLINDLDTCLKNLDKKKYKTTGKYYLTSTSKMHSMQRSSTVVNPYQTYSKTTMMSIYNKDNDNDNDSSSKKTLFI